jgi:type II secretory pathway component GspD/PulD (secretin)
MQGTRGRVAWAAGVLVAAALTPAARGQVVIVSASAATPTIRVQTTAAVPDGGTVTLGGVSQLSESRSEYGAPVLGKTPCVGRGFRNVGYGRTVTSVRVTASVRVIDLREEEYRQTGYITR